MKFYRKIFLKFLKLVNSFGTVGEKSIYITTKKFNINKYLLIQPTKNQFYLPSYQIKKILPNLLGKAQNGNVATSTPTLLSGIFIINILNYKKHTRKIN